MSEEAASLTLLKNGSKTKPKEEAGAGQAQDVEDNTQDGNTPTPGAEVGEIPNTAGDSEEIDVDNMSGKELDKLVQDFEIEVPSTWSKMKVAEKKKWLNDTYGDEASGTAEAPAEEAPAEVSPAGKETNPNETSKADDLGISDQVEAAPDTKSKSASKGAVSSAAGKNGTVEQPGVDVIQDMVHDIENMSEEKAIEEVETLLESTEHTMFRVGGLLSAIQSHGWYQPYASFKEFVETRLGMHYRKASYWASIYNDLVEADISWESVSGIGWTKLAQLAPILTKDNVDAWVQAASKQTTVQLIESIKAWKQQGQTAVTDQSQNAVTTKTFKLHNDQRQTVDSALDKAKEDSGTDIDSAALEFLCLDYVGSATIVDRLQKMGIESAMAAVEKAFPEANITVES